MKNVLLVDDDKIFNFLSTKTLQRMGVASEINTALNGKEAIDLLNTHYNGLSAPDVILLDLNMPIMDGFGFLEAFKNLKIDNKHKIKIVVLSSSEDPRDIEKALGLGADKYLSKPLTEAMIRLIMEDDASLN